MHVDFYVFKIQPFIVMLYSLYNELRLKYANSLILNEPM